MSKQFNVSSIDTDIGKNIQYLVISVPLEFIWKITHTVKQTSNHDKILNYWITWDVTISEEIMPKYKKTHLERRN